MKINKILGKHGRITIPYEFRIKIGFKCNDVVSFEMHDDTTVIIRREKICDECEKTEIETVSNDDIIDDRLLDFFAELSDAEQRTLIIKLYTIWAHTKDGDKNA